MFHSLKDRLAAGAFLILATVLIASGVVLYFWLSEELNDQLRESLLVVAKGASAQVAVEHDFLEIYHNRVDHYLEDGPSLFLQVLNARGVVLYGPEEGLAGFDYRPASTSAEEWRTFDWNGTPVLALKYTFSAVHEYGYGSEQDTPYHAAIIVGMDRTPVLHTLAGFRTTIIVATCVGSVLGAVLLKLLSSLATRPLDELARKIDAIDHQHLTPLAPVRHLPSECNSVFDELNLLINRVEQELLRERTFTSNISHELRTPLTGLRSTLEVSMGQDKRPEDFFKSQEVCLQIVLETQSLVDTLLRMRRLESGNFTPEKEEAALQECVQASWDNFSERAGQRNLICEWEVPDDIPLHVPLDLFLTVLNNLIENAVEYAIAGGILRIQATRASDTWTLSIANSQTGLNQENLQQMFEPFWRGDQSRAATGTHAGLGLSIVQSMVKYCGLTLESALKGDLLIMTLQGRLAESTNVIPNTAQPIATGPLESVTGMAKAR